VALKSYHSVSTPQADRTGRYEAPLKAPREAKTPADRTMELNRDNLAATL